jgi:hypothetical protein
MEKVINIGWIKVLCQKGKRYHRVSADRVKVVVDVGF